RICSAPCSTTAELSVAQMGPQRPDRRTPEDSYRRLAVFLTAFLAGLAFLGAAFLAVAFLGAAFFGAAFFGAAFFPPASTASLNAFSGVIRTFLEALIWM